MNVKIPLLEKEIPRIEILQDDVQASSAKNYQNSSKSFSFTYNPSHQANLPSKIFQIAPIYNKISKAYFNENLTHEGIFLRDDYKKVQKLGNLQKKTLDLRSKLKSLSTPKDPYINDIKTRILNTNQRLKQSKAGGVLESSMVSKGSYVSVDRDSNSFNQKAHRKKLRDSVRASTFEQKLGFYEENPLIAKRRIETEHLPWEQPAIPVLPSTPENSKYFSTQPTVPKTIIKPPKKSKYYSTLSLDFITNPKLLGPKGKKLLVQIINDEKKNVKASKAEIEELNKIINKRISLIKSRERGPKQDVFTYIVDKVLMKPTSDASSLIKSYFNSYS